MVYFNAGKASISGFEADINAALLPGLLVTVNYAMLDADVEEVINPQTGENEAEQYSCPAPPRRVTPSI